MQDKENLNFNFLNGYQDSGDTVEVPAGSLIRNSFNIIYTRKGRPVSIKDALYIDNIGGNRAFTLDDALVGFLGNNITSEVGRGNMFQGVGKNLWFVGNSLANGVRVFSDFPSANQEMLLGGTFQQESVTVTAGASSSATIVVRVSKAFSPVISNNIPVLNGDTATQVAEKIAIVLRADSLINSEYYVRRYGATITLIDKSLRVNDAVLEIFLHSAAGTGVTLGASTTTATGAMDFTADLSSIPQLAKWNGTGWNSPVQVGMAVQEDAPQLSLTTDVTRDAYFEGILTGSFSARVARKRGGSISIASGSSNVVTGETDSSYMFIPPYPEDGSLITDRNWVLYFTPKGKGSIAAHRQFPIEIPENKLDGTESVGWTSTVGNARVKVISQHSSDILQRKIEIEYFDNDLLLLEPFDDYFAAESAKFVAPLGNVVCLVGTGSDSTGFDVSFPNFREAYTPEWRDWFAEVPVDIASASELGMFWVMTANTTYQAVWTGATQQTAPVILRQISSKVGVRNEGASVVVNGTLYLLTEGGTPARISADGEVDLEFGNKVTKAFENITENVKLVYDEETNSVLWISVSTVMAWQIDNQIWSALSEQTVGDVRSAFSLGKHSYLCGWDGGEFLTYKYNAEIGNLTWVALSAFQTGESWLKLKDIIEGKIVVESPFNPYTVIVTGYKNYDSDAFYPLFSQSVDKNGIHISPRKLVESLDYESVAIKAVGNGGGQTVHGVTVTVDIHEIEKD